MQIQALLDFLKKPRYERDPDTSLSHRLRNLFLLLIWALALSLCFGLLLGIADSLGPWDVDEHAMGRLLEEFSPIGVFLLACLAAPALEELVFRGPMWFFRNSAYFPWIFYGLTLAFALVHLGNFPNLFEIWPLALLLISPQLNIGVFLGFVRVRYGLLWAIAFHSVYNFVLLGPMLLLYQLGMNFS